MPMVAAAREMFSLARSGKHASSDFSAMADALCEAAGIERDAGKVVLRAILICTGAEREGRDRAEREQPLGDGQVSSSSDELRALHRTPVVRGRIR